ncbi:glycan biosynthesis hexose transferase WsfD [Paramaledivibacter caminithermalis]|jgi:hypothetical protein|uniref:Transmembrane protein n=1 Tax=Paramaledivibacter caminithermalis (strain DSM 15212 / CIP 107654 / DViRD3) TaxID=1121301 RepID=A0A1M6MSY1_PARC5|nr:hypothetical protein [Paramaledivibacter caminithermalis]SHJ86522.1 hypothetical protein SAMN02745912_01402 [Paramaledivibacter caminithermalis DSM 15212]
MNKYIKPSTFAVILLFIIGGYALFFEPLIGLADNGDFFRIMAPNDLKHEEDRDVNVFGYFTNKYDKLQYYNGLKGKIKSTQNIIIQIAIKIDDFFTKDEKFDIRFQAIICLIILGISLYWMVEIVLRMTDSEKLKYFLAIIAVIIFGDIGYIAYFNSFYGESIAYPFYILSIASILKFSSSEHSRIRYLVIYFIASFIFMGSKNQFAVNGILSSILLVSLIFFKIKNYKKVLVLVLSVFFLISTALMYIVIDENIYLINKYHMITRGVMLFEPDVEKVTKEVGLNRQYSLLAETIYFDRTPIIHPKDDLLLKDFYSKYNLASVVIYYFKKPDAFMKIMKLGWKNSFTIRPEVLGNFKRSAGREFGEKAKFFSLWSHFKDNNIPHNSGLVLIFLVICLSAGINRVLKYKGNKYPQITYYREAIMIYVFLTGFSQILVSLIGAGDTDLKKHLFMTTVTLDILFYFNFAYIVSILYHVIETKSK